MARRDTLRGPSGSDSTSACGGRCTSTSPRCSGRCTASSRARTQVQEGIELRPPFRIAWSREDGSLIEFPAVVVRRRGLHRQRARRHPGRLDEDGKIAWRRDATGRMAASPAILGRHIVAHTMSGTCFVLDRYNGAIPGRCTIGSPIESSPVVRQRHRLLRRLERTIYALDLKTGHAKWTLVGTRSPRAPRCTAGRSSSATTAAGCSRSIGATGSLRWSGSVNGRIYGTPAVAEGRVFVPSSSGGSITAFSVNGSRLWSRSTGSYVYSSPAAWDGRVFVGSYDGLLYGLSASSGSTLWTANAGGRISGAAVVVAGIVYAGTTRRIIGVDARTGRVRLTFAHGDYVPVSGTGSGCSSTAPRGCTRWSRSVTTREETASRARRRRAARGRRRGGLLLLQAGPGG